MSKEKSNTENQQLIASYITGNASDEEQSRLKELINQNDQIRQEYEDFKASWQNLGLLKSNPEQAYNRFMDEVSRLENNKTRNVFNTVLYRNPFIRIAAVLLLTASLLFLYFHGDLSLTLETTDNKIINHTLPDESLVSLNKATEFQYTENKRGRKRTVLLNGEAFFEINNKSGHPFIIHSGNIILEILGTSFNVNAYPDDSLIIVAVRTGIVKMVTRSCCQSHEKHEIIEAGQYGVYNKNDGSLEVSDSFNLNIFAWKTDSLYFEQTPLKYALMDIENYYGVPITLSNPELGDLRLSARYYNKDLTTVLSAICLSFNLVFEEKANGVFILGKGI